MAEKQRKAILKDITPKRKRSTLFTVPSSSEEPIDDTTIVDHAVDFLNRSLVEDDDEDDALLSSIGLALKDALSSLDEIQHDIDGAPTKDEDIRRITVRQIQLANLFQRLKKDLEGHMVVLERNRRALEHLKMSAIYLQNHSYGNVELAAMSEVRGQPLRPSESRP